MRRTAFLRALALAGAMSCLASAHAADGSPSHRNNDRPPPAIAQGASGPAVLRAQVLLDRQWFTSGEIDGRFGDNMRKAVLAFQKAHGLKETGRIDAATWRALDDDGTPGTTTYRVTDADVAGPFERVPDDMMQRAKLAQLGYESVEEALAEKFHASPALLRELNRGRKFVAGAEIVVPDVRSDRIPGKAATLEVVKSQHIMRVNDRAGRTIAQFPVSIGGPSDPLPVGRLKITNEVKNPVFTYDPALLKDAKPEYTKVDIAPGPNNPVGTIWIGLSKPHWGIHGTPSPSKVGREETNGCLHLTNWDAEKLSALVAAGTPLDVVERE